MNHQHGILAISLGALVLSATCGGVAAQAVYRCGNSYSQQPCEGAQTVAPPGQTPSAAQQAQARSNTARDAKLANDMEKARLKQEAKPAAAYIPVPNAQTASAAGPAGKAAKKKAGTKAASRKPEHFTAVVPGSGRHRPAQ